MPNKPEHPADEQSDTKDDGAQKDKVPQTNKKPRARRVRHLAVWLVLLGLLAQYVESFDHRLLYPSLILALLCFVVAAVVQRGEAINFGATHRRASLQATVIFVVGLVICGGLYWWKRGHEPRATPRFKLVLTSPERDLELTNDFLRFNTPPRVDTPPPGDLVVPAKSMDELPSLAFKIVNDSDVASDSILVIFTLANDLEFDTEPGGWEKFVRDGEKNSRSVAVQIDSIFPKNGVALPDLALRRSAAISNDRPALAGIQIVPKNRSDSFVTFWLYVPVSTNITKPHVVHATNGFFTVPSDTPSPASFHAATHWSNFFSPPRYWFVDEYGGTKRRTKVAGSVLIEFTNLRPVPMMVAMYAVQEQTTNGVWKTAETFGSLTHGQVFFGEDPKQMREVKYQTFDSAVQGRNIAPNETIRGWLVFKTFPQGNLRLKVSDTIGNTYVEPFYAALTEDLGASDPAHSGWPVQPTLFELSRTLEDISDLPQW